MSCKAIELVDGIVEILNDPTNLFVLAFTAEKRMAPFAGTELDEVKDLRVLVFPGATHSERLTRGLFQRTFRPVIAVQKRLDGLDEASKTAQSSVLLELVEQIEEVLEGPDVSNFAFIGFDAQEREPYNASAMLAVSFFSTAIVLEYQPRN